MDKRLYNNKEISNAELVNRDTFERLMAKKRHKKVFRSISYVLLSIVLCFVFVVICMAVFLKIEKIEVRGNEKYSSKQIVEASGISVGENLYAINKKTARGFITTEYPYINEVIIRRDLPSTLVFKIKEEQPKYYTELCGEYFVLSESMRILERTYENPSTEENPLVLLLVSDVKKAVVGEEIEFEKELTFEYINKFIQGVNEHEIAKDLTRIDMSKKYNIYVTYQNRFRIYLGDNTETEMKLKFAKLMIDNFDENKSGTVDAHDITVGSVILDS